MVQKLLKYNTPDLVNLKKEIVKERKFDVPDDFFRNINDDFIMWAIFDVSQSNERDNFIRRYGKRFRSYKHFIVTCIDLNNFDNVYVFNQEMIAKWCHKLRSNISDENMAKIIYNYAIYEDVDINLIYTYIKNAVRLNPFTFTSSESDLFNAIRDTMRGLLILVKDLTSDENIITRVQSACVLVANNLSYLVKCPSELEEFDIERFYEEYKSAKFIALYKSISVGLLENLKYYLKTDCKYEIPDDIVDDMEYELNRFVSSVTRGLNERLSDNQKSWLRCQVAETYWDIVLIGLKKNANNLKLLKIFKHFISRCGDVFGFFSDDVIDTIIKNIRCSKIPLKDFKHVVRLSKYNERVRTVYIDAANSSFINHLIRKGVNLTTLVDAIPIDRYCVQIISYSSKKNIKKLMELNPSLMWGAYTDKKGMSLNDFIVGEVIRGMTPDTVYKVVDIVLGDINIWRTLNSDNKLFIASSVHPIEYVKTHPESAQIPTIQSALTITMVNDLLRENKNIVSYITNPALMSSMTLENLVSAKGWVKLNDHMASLYIPSAEMVIKLITDYNVGFGYILDILNTHGQNAVVDYILTVYASNHTN